MQRSFDCTVQWLRSLNTGREFPNLVFRADVDFATSGMISLTSGDRPEVVAVMLTSDEYNSSDMAAGCSACEARVNAELARDDLRIPRFMRSEDTFSAPDGVSFQEYQKLYKPPKLFYADIHNANGEAEVVREESIDEFLASGGTLIDRISGT